MDQRKRIQLTMYQVAAMYAALPNPWEHMKMKGPSMPHILLVLNQGHYERMMEMLAKCESSNINTANIPPMIIYDEIAFVLDTESKEMQWEPSSHIIEIK